MVASAREEGRRLWGERGVLSSNFQPLPVPVKNVILYKFLNERLFATQRLQRKELTLPVYAICYFHAHSADFVNLCV